MTKRMGFGDGLVLFNMIVSFGLAIWFSAHFLYLLVFPDDHTNRAAEFLQAFGAWYITVIQFELLSRRRDADEEVSVRE